MYGIISYIIISEVASLLNTIPGAIAFVVALLVFMGGFGVLLCVLVRHGNRHEKKVDEDTMTLPSTRAGKMRRKYLG